MAREIIFLCKENLDTLITFEANARETETEIFTTDFDRKALRDATAAALDNPLYASARCMLCMDGTEVIGRLDFVLLPSLAFGGEVRVYVDWVYVLKTRRGEGVARFLFDEMEKYIRTLGVGEYFLITAQNEEARRFYNGFAGAENATQKVMTRRIGDD